MNFNEMIFMSEKIEEKIASNGVIVIPKKWRDYLGLNRNQRVELELKVNKIIISKKEHPLKEAIGLFDDIPSFSEELFTEAKKSLFRIDENGEFHNFSR
jgi:AbrB family looped-hinge helix DNA binding protein